MAQAVQNPLDCCNPSCCSDLPTTQIPGAPGPAGPACTPCNNGVNAFTLLNGGFVMPAELGSVTTLVDDNTWMVPLEYVFIQSAGYLKITAVNVDGVTVTLFNPSVAASGLYPANAAPGSAIPNDSKVSPGGIQGPSGVSPASGAPKDATYITQTPNGTLTNEQALSLLATGYMKSTTGTGVVSTQAVPIPIADGGTNAITAALARASLATAPNTPKYILQQANAELASAQDLSALASGLMYVTTATGVITSVASLPWSTLVGAFPIATVVFPGVTLDATYYTALCDATGGNMVIALPAAASCSGRIYNIKKIDASGNTVTIDPNLAELIDGAATKIIAAQWTSVMCQSNGSAWYIL